MISTVILFIIGFILITKGADIFINCTVEIGKKTHVSELVLGATIVSFATTLPELTVSLCASINNQTTMSLGNAVGSIICNTGLILGLVAFISPFKVDRKMFLSKSTLLLISILGLVIVGLDGTVNEKDSIVLLIILAIFMYTNYKSVTSEKVSKRSVVNLQEKKNIDTKAGELLKIICLFLLGLVMMVVGSRLLVDNGSDIAKFIGIPQGIISLTIIALGTSLPELVSSLTAIRKKHHAISVGNVLGANILNITSVIALSSIPNDIPILSQNVNIDYPFMIALILMLILPTIKKNKLYRFQGLMLLLLYGAYITTLYFMYIS
ncbi:sodium:calcium antiporter [Romboutsia ilealis]|uniref:Calcium/sodium antiporter n=1 Tax=Romboutsia faecis TaxID=2764597 RepID=A0ABR7JRG8_9FIRM|nr:calcium/sodium antiporter [Romboutsia faecis]MBC5997518.1 calcium/sodium antiporter [Romboutsia faecis]MRN24849.1 sodium:calcium antiporter [Romboutsia ilealis]